ncbi:HAD family hydrolase [Methanosphaera sp.]|uniref:HAD family hydrolase n=1 Tax=Methanosphaera sp. TaxID=2666342 RepID=UPI0025F22B5F|nr:HAD family hydrolase [Methanosphaera sp.]
MKKFYIFDFDGTLVNTFYDSVIAYNKALKQNNLPEYTYESLDQIDYSDFINSMTEDMQVLKLYSKIYEESEKEYTLPYDGINEVLKELIKRGNEVAICSNRSQEQLEYYTEKLFPEINFKYVIGYTPEGGFKPNPEVMNRILNNVNYKKGEIVYIGDKKTDIVTAQNVELDVIIVTWGQGDEEAYYDNYPIKIIDNVKELLDF